MELIFMLYGIAGTMNALSFLCEGKYPEIPAIVWLGVGVKLQISEVPIVFAIIAFIIAGLSILQIARNNINTRRTISSQPEEGPKNTEV